MKERIEVTEEKDFQADDFASAFNLYCDLDTLEAQRDRLAAAAERSTGLERESNIRQMMEVERAIDAAQAALKALATPTTTEQKQPPEGRQRQQEHEILAALRELGYNPMSLPARQPGKPGARAEVRKRLSHMTDAVFKKAWERLRSFGEVAGAQ